MGKTLFAQAMAYLPWKNFARIVDRHGGDKGVPAHSTLADALNLRDWRIDHAGPWDRVVTS